MPGFDGTGPRGMGPMTGGGRGFCAMPLPGSWPPYGTPWGMPATPFAPQMSKEQELDFLKGQTEALKGQLGQIDVRIQELEGEIKS